MSKTDDNTSDGETLESEAPAATPAGETDDDGGASEAKASTKKEDETSEEGGDDNGESGSRNRRSRSRRSRTRRKPRGGGNKRDDRGDADADAKPANKLRATALWALHKERRAKMVPFAGYEMPVQYKRGIMAEHTHTRDRAGLFDVSHMGQAFLTLEGEGGHEEIAALVEELVPGNIRGLKPGGIKYTLLLNDEGGIIDDLMVTRPEGEAGDGMLFLVVNAGCKEKDFAHISEKLDGRAKLTIAGDRALIALQGPLAAKVLARHAPFVTDMGFMTALSCRIDGVECIVSRCGYTGEDGYEISVPNEMAETLTRKLLAHREVALVGLGARDSLRLEAGLCLYGHDITEETTPAEADLMWTMTKRRKEARDFPGADKIMAQIEEGIERKRVGIKPEGKAPAREGTDVVDADGNVIGKVTSGGFGPTVGGPVAMGYVSAAFCEEGAEIFLMIRGQARPAKVVALPFVEPRQHRPGKTKAPSKVAEVKAEEPEAQDPEVSSDEDAAPQEAEAATETAAEASEPTEQADQPAEETADEEEDRK